MIKKILIVCVCFIVITLGFSFNVKADMGPKPTLKIIVSNAPKEEYYLDLLVDYNESYNYNLGKDDQYDEGKLKIFNEYNEEGWRPALVTGTPAPLWGKLIGEKSGDKVIHNFGYVGIPKKFRIIILTKDNKIFTSDVIEIKAFNEVINYDFKSKEISQRSVAKAYFGQVAYTLIFTLLIEGIVLLCFGFSLKKNWKPFLAINIATQIFLNIALSYALIIYGTYGAFVFFLPIEIVIFIIEIALFLKLLKHEDREMIVKYVITANLCSLGIGLILMKTVFFVPFGY